MNDINVYGWVGRLIKMSLQNALQERAFAFAKYYKERDEKREWISSIYSAYTNLLHIYAKGNHGVEEALWELAYQIPLTQKHFTEYMDGEKTVRKTIKVKVEKDGEEIEEDKAFHFTQEGVRYKEWKEGDQPCYYMKEYLIQNRDFDGSPIDVADRKFKINKYGFFQLNDKYLAKMSKGKRAKYEAGLEDEEARNLQLSVWNLTSTKA